MDLIETGRCEVIKNDANQGIFWNVYNDTDKESVNLEYGQPLTLLPGVFPVGTVIKTFQPKGCVNNPPKSELKEPKIQSATPNNNERKFLCKN